MANKDPAFLFYSSDFLMGVSDLTMEERGQYITLMCLQHQKGHLTDRTVGLALGYGWVSTNSEVLKKFTKDEKGSYFNKRLESEIEKRGKHLERQRENGSKGGRPKTQTQTQTEPNTKPRCEPKQKPLEDENDNENENVIREEIGSQEGKFLKFWEAYPNKVAQSQAEREFSTLNPSDQLFAIILESLEKWKKSSQWTKEDGEYIPYPEKWLREGMWESEIKPAANKKQNFEGVQYSEEFLKELEVDPDDLLKRLQAEEVKR